MAKSKSYTTLMINDTAWVFSLQKFRSLIEEKIHRSRLDGRGVTNTQINKELSDVPEDHNHK